MTRHLLFVRFVPGLAESTGHAAESSGWDDEVRIDLAKKASPDLPRLLWHEYRHVAWDHELLDGTWLGVVRANVRHFVLDVSAWVGLDRAAFVVLGRPRVEWVDLDDVPALLRRATDGLLAACDEVAA